MHCNYCSKKFSSNDLYQTHLHESHFEKSLTINGKKIFACLCKQLKLTKRRYHYHCPKCNKAVLKFNYGSQSEKCDLQRNKEKQKIELKQPSLYNREHFASTPKKWKSVTNKILEVKPLEENILKRPDFVKDNAKCGSLNIAADNLIKRTQNEENKNVDQLQLKSLANPVNIETISKCNVFIQSVFNNPVSVTNDNDKIQDAKGPSNISAEIKQTVKNKCTKIESGSDIVLSHVVTNNHRTTIQANSDSNWDTDTADSNSFFTELIESQKTLEMESDVWEKLFSEKTKKKDGKFLLPREWARVFSKKI